MSKEKTKLEKKLELLYDQRLFNENRIVNNLKTIISLIEKYYGRGTIKLEINNLVYQFNADCKMLKIIKSVVSTEKVKKEVKTIEKKYYHFLIDVRSPPFTDYDDMGEKCTHDFTLKRSLKGIKSYEEILNLCKPLLDDFYKTKEEILKILLEKYNVTPEEEVCSHCGNKITTSDGKYCSNCGYLIYCD